MNWDPNMLDLVLAFELTREKEEEEGDDED